MGAAAALACCAQVPVTDFEAGGTATRAQKPATRAVACLVRGRILAAQGQQGAARQAFAHAAAGMRRARHALLEAMAYHERARCLP
jgi:hypothetical protein